MHTYSNKLPQTAFFLFSAVKFSNHIVYLKPTTVAVETLYYEKSGPKTRISHLFFNSKATKHSSLVKCVTVDY